MTSAALPVRHISIRVPWSDLGWTGRICRNPLANQSCLVLRRTSENRDDEFEAENAGRAWSELATEQLPPCAEEHGAFMSDCSYKRSFTHPYQSFEPGYEGFRETTYVHPAYSASCTPYAWMLRDLVRGEEGEIGRAERYGIDYDENREPTLKHGNPTWIQARDNQLALLDAFFSAVQPEASLCFFYAKATPLSEDPRRVIMAVGRVSRVEPFVEYVHATDERPNSVVWERNVHHTIREKCENGFLLPYHELVELAGDDTTLDLEPFVAFAPDEAFDAFSFGSEHVTDDEAIASLSSVLNALEAMKDVVTFDVQNAIAWLNAELNRLWKMRGPFPGLGSALEAFGVTNGTLVALEIERKLRDADGIWSEDPWSWVERAIEDLSLLPQGLHRYLGPRILGLYRQLPEERRALLKLLSRFAITVDQARRFYQPSHREARGVEQSDGELIENPYLFFELDRGAQDPIPATTIDRGVFAQEFINQAYPLPGLDPIKEALDPRRVRALAVDVLEDSARSEGNTLLLRDTVIEGIEGLRVFPRCPASRDVFDAYERQFSSEFQVDRNAKNNVTLQLERLSDVGRRIREFVLRRVERGRRHEASYEWRQLVDEAIEFEAAADDLVDQAGRKEKAVALAELFAARMSVLVGPAGTGKTTLLKALASIAEVASGDVLFLAPTGKARVRMEQVTKNFRAQTIAQFLLKLGRYDTETGAYRLLGSERKSVEHRTVVIDEASMLTEEQLAATIDALGAVKRFILVGDTRQLPPIGAGRPFVDIANALKVRQGGYAELRVQQRRKGAESRLDVQLASWFSDTRDDPESDLVWDRIAENGDSNILNFIRWDTPRELQNNLTVALKSSLAISGEDTDWFETSIGGSEYEGHIYFRAGRDGKDGAGSETEAWQILSPVWARDWGVEALNDFVHRRYRGDAIERAQKEKMRSRRTIAPAGPQRLIYGDKVINVRNKSRSKVWPRDGSIQYVANGEIGTIVGECRWGNSTYVPRNIAVEFSTQPGHEYKFWRSEIEGEQGKPTLDLAYAITVHKSQGSEFSKVFLVLPANNPLLSRELLYTALTRHKVSLTVLHQGDLSELKAYASGDRSEVARRLTNLFETPDPIFVSVSDKPVMMDNRLIHRTSSGLFVRSKSEVIVADILSGLGLEYDYEKPFVGSDGTTRYPDFTVEDDDTGETVVIEHLGMLSDPGYRAAWEKKLVWYRVNGVDLAGGTRAQLLITQDAPNGSIDAAEIEERLRSVFGR